MKKKSLIKLNIFILSFFLVFLYIIFDFRLMRIEGESMYPVLLEDEFIIISRGSYGIPRLFKPGYKFQWNKPDKKDIIVFYNPMDNTLSVKRCVGVPGDHLELKQTVFYINGIPLPPSALPPAAGFRNGVIPDNWYFLIGDNYGQSVDSRYFGLVPVDLIFGKALYREKLP